MRICYEPTYVCAVRKRFYHESAFNVSTVVGSDALRYELRVRVNKSLTGRGLEVNCRLPN